MTDPTTRPRPSHSCPECGGPARVTYRSVSGDPGDVEPVLRCTTPPCPYGWEA